jgi:hypothetical protein
MNTENNFKKFLISKMAKLNTDLNSNYKDIFENPDNYLSISPNVVIGINFSRRNKVKELLDPNILKIILLFHIQL